MDTSLQTYWFAARTRYGQELKIRDRLQLEGVEHFIPTFPAKGPRKEKVIVSNLIFLHTTKDEALELVNTGIIPAKYIVDCATHTLLVVPDKQMEDFRRVWDFSLNEDGLVDHPLSVGESVRVVKGPLAGVEGNVVELQGRYYVYVSLLGSIYTRVKVPRSWIEIIKVYK